MWLNWSAFGSTGVPEAFGSTGGSATACVSTASVCSSVCSGGGGVGPTGLLASARTSAPKSCMSDLLSTPLVITSPPSPAFWGVFSGELWLTSPGNDTFTHAHLINPGPEKVMHANRKTCMHHACGASSPHLLYTTRVLVTQRYQECMHQIPDK